MTPDLIVERAAAGDLRPLRLNPGVAGVGEAFFRRIAGLLSSQPSAAVALGRRWQSFLRYGDAPAYVWRGRGAALRADGRWKASGIAFRRAGELAAAGVDQCVFQLGAIDSMARAGQTEAAVALGRQLATRLEALGEWEAAARARLNLGNALIWTDRYAEAQHEYRAVLSANPGTYECASAHLGLSTSLLHGGNPAEAAVHASEAAVGFADLDFELFGALAGINVAHSKLLSGRPEDAWSEFMSLREEVVESPPDRARVDEFLGDTYLELSLFEDSVRAYEEALEANQAMPLNHANSWLGLGQAWVALGDERQATQAFDRAQRLYRRIGNSVWECVALTERAHLNRDSVSLERLAARLNELEAPYWSTRAALLAAFWGRTEHLEEAVRTIERHGYVGLQWRADWVRARISGRIEDYRRMVGSILTQRLLTRSTSARLNFLRDKSVAMREVFALLIDAGTEEARSEALQILRQTRSAALIDELMADPAAEPLRLALEQLRSEIGPDAGSDQPGGGSRRLLPAIEDRTVSVVTLRDVRAYAEQQGSAITADSTWIDLGDRWACLSDEGSRIFPSERIKTVLRWLLFEVMEPLMDRATPADACKPLIEELRRELGQDGRLLCPDGVLWQVPWALVTTVEPTIILNPAGRDPRCDRLPKEPRVAIWYQESEGLPHILEEVDCVRQRFPQATVCDSARAVRELLARGEHYDLVHVATHAQFTASNAMFAHFAFADGPVHAFEIAHSAFRVDAAVLAACNTGQLSPTVPDEPNGFVRAFLARGARAVVAGLWPLDDEAALILTKALYTQLERGGNWGQALLAARLACQNELPHPYFWGGTMLYGGLSHA